MRRAAFFLLAIRFGLSLLFLMIGFPHEFASISRLRASMPPAVADSIAFAFRVNEVLIIAQWIISALIVWYVYKVTKPEALLPQTYESQASPDPS